MGLEPGGLLGESIIERMVIDMNEAQVCSLERVLEVLAGTQALEFRQAQDDALVLPTDTAPQVVAAAQALSPVGLLINAPRANLLRFMPALTISDEEIDRGMQLLRQALRAAMG